MFIIIIVKIIPSHLLQPGADVPNVWVPNVHSTVVTHALDVRPKAVEAPVPLGVVEPAVPSCRALFIPVISIISVALTAIKPGKPHLWLFLLSGTSVHGNIIEAGVLYAMQGFETACSALFVRLKLAFCTTYAVVSLF